MSKFEFAVNNYKKFLIVDVLQKFNGNQCQAAKALGIHRNTMSRLIQTLDIQLGPKGHRGIHLPPVPSEGLRSTPWGEVLLPS
jgi:Fis family transcriptional regulator, factor for inversion stimulation protein